MTKSLALAAASVATLAAFAMAPASAAPKAQPTEESITVAGSNVEVVEHGYGHRYHRCYWGWRHGYKIWICY